MKYLTQLLDKRVVSPQGAFVGSVVDAVAIPGKRLPELNALILRGHNTELCIPYEEVEFDPDPAGPQGSGQIVGDVRLCHDLNAITACEPQSDALRLRRDVLDRQIVDVHDYRVVRVSDVRLAEVGGRYCVVGVDASLRATLRRLGFVGTLVEKGARLVRRPLRSNLIAWDDVQTLEPGTAGARIQLKVSHDKIARLHPSDIAEIVEQLTPQQGADVMEGLDPETAAYAMAEVEPEVQVQIMQQLDNETAADILEEMGPDEAADLLDDLPNVRSDALLERMEPEEAENVLELMGYDDDTAGGLMTTELVAILANLTCEQTINHLRELAPKAETIYYVYVVDEEERLVGVLSLRDLVIAPPQTNVSEIMVRNVIHVYVDNHANQVAQIIGRYNLLAVPVVSDEEKLLGIITVDDALDRLLPHERRRRLPIPAFSSEED